jgi:hypothetical protein
MAIRARLVLVRSRRLFFMAIDAGFLRRARGRVIVVALRAIQVPFDRRLMFLLMALTARGRFFLWRMR